MGMDEWVKEIEAGYSTSGHKKFIRYLEEVVDTEPFQKEVVRLRKKYKIPPNGFTKFY